MVSKHKVYIQPKKKLSQNFLVNQQMQLKIANKMRDFAKKYSPDFILEIGPGQGDLTQYFVDLDKKLVLVEIDHHAITFLKQRFSDTKNIEIFNEDGLDFIFQKKLPNFVLLSNLPFNCGSRILVDLAVYYPNSPFAVILQKEVAQKIRLDKPITFFGAWLNLFWEIKIENDISPGNFYPSPKVYSTLITAKPKLVPKFLKIQENRQNAKHILKSLFAKPRKTIVNNLKETEFAFTSLQFADQRLSWQNYIQVLEVLMRQVFKNLN